MFGAVSHENGWGQILPHLFFLSNENDDAGFMDLLERLPRRDLWVTPVFSSSASAFRYGASGLSPMTNEYCSLALKIKKIPIFRVARGGSSSWAIILRLNLEIAW